MNRQLIERTRRTIEQIATEHGITIEQIIILIEWPHDDLPSPDIIPTTPSELEERVKDEHDITAAIESDVVAETATG